MGRRANTNNTLEDRVGVDWFDTKGSHERLFSLLYRKLTYKDDTFIVIPPLLRKY